METLKQWQLVSPSGEELRDHLHRPCDIPNGMTFADAVCLGKIWMKYHNTDEADLLEFGADVRTGKMLTLRRYTLKRDW